MPRQELLAAFTDYAAHIHADQSWTTAEHHGAHLARMVDAYIVDTDLYRELAAVRAAANRTIDGLQADNDALRARLAAQETAVAV
jgi:hypothetical protein